MNPNLRQPAASKSPQQELQVMMITPETANEWLNTKCRPKNRKVSEKNVKKYANAMQAGQWQLNNDSITFDDEGFLANGHHRLKACIQAGVAFPTFVHLNVPKEAYRTMDVPTKRTMADTLSLLGVKEHKVIGQALPWIARFQNKRLMAADESSYHDLGKIYEADQAGFDDAAEFIKGKFKGILSPQIALFLLYVFRKHDREKADFFMTRLSTAENLDIDNPILRCRDTLTNPLLKGAHKLTTYARLAYIFKAWNMYLSGKTGKWISMPKGGVEKTLKSAPIVYGDPEPHATA